MRINPPKKKVVKGRTQPLYSFQLDPKLVERMDERAHKLGYNRTEWLRYIIEAALKEKV